MQSETSFVNEEEAMIFDKTLLPYDKDVANVQLIRGNNSGICQGDDEMLPSLVYKTNLNTRHPDISSFIS